MTPTSPLPTPPAPVRVRLDGMGDLIAGIPGILGFPPTDSLVLLTFTEGEPIALGATIRVDLPPPAHVPGIVDQLCAAALTNDAAAAVAVVVDGRGDPPLLPHRLLVESLADLLGEADIPLAHAVWVANTERGATWWCYLDDECLGAVPEPRDSPLAAVTGAAGFADRDELIAQLAPDPDDRLAHRAELLDALVTGDAPGVDELDRELALVHAAVEAVAAGGVGDLDDERIVRLAVALADPRVRDECLAMALTERADAAERLWAALVRAVPAPERAEPACLLGVAAYLRGQGVLANAALENAVAADPDHGLAAMLLRAIAVGTPPPTLRRLLGRSVADAESVAAGAERPGPVRARNGPG